jgi:hypothetical protein
MTASSPSTAQAGLLRIGIIVLTFATALTHIWLAFSMASPDPVFILNGLGYLGLLGALYLPLPFLDGWRRQIRWALMAYTALTIVLWIAFGARTPIGYINKATEVLLLVLLYLEDRRA